MANFAPLNREPTFQTSACLAWAIILWQFDGIEDVVLGVADSDQGPRTTKPSLAFLRLHLQHSMRIEDTLKDIFSQISHASSSSLVGATEMEYSSMIVFSSRKSQNVCRNLPSLWWNEAHDPIISLPENDEWKRSQMTARLQYCCNIIRSVPHGPLSDLLGASSAELNTIEAWNRSPLTCHHRCIHHLIEERVQKQPHSPAVESWDGTFTYAELDHISSRYVHLLRSKGIGPERCVGLYLSKCRWTAVAMLAVLKAGGAFVLLEKSHPVERLKSMCQAAKVSLILSKSIDGLSKDVIPPGYSVLEMEHGDTPGKLQSLDLSASQSPPTQAAYVAFTSGSTGLPKGAVIEHNMFVSGSLSHGPAYKMTPSTRVFQFSSYAFDGAIMEHLSTLIAGGCVCIPSMSEQLNDLPGAFSKLRANWICLTPSVLYLLLPSQMPSLKTLIVTGESMSKELVQTWASKVQLIVTYGPTECSVASSSTSPIHAGDDPRVLGSTHNCRFWVVDPESNRQLVPPGAVGELFIEGPIVGRGYVNVGSVTTARFETRRPWLLSIPDPDRIYRTGDLVQYTGIEGYLRYLGRKDAQVKIRGQRIELEEIEHSIRDEFKEVPKLNIAVEAAILPGNRQNKSLIAFQGLSRTSAGEKGALAPPCSELIQQWNQHIKPSLLQKLPNYMIPTMIIPLAKFPFTLTGKTDRKQLRAIISELSRQTLDSYLAISGAETTPGSLMEPVIKEAVGQVLNIPPRNVNTSRNFFELGGDSVDAMRLVSILRARKVQLTVAKIASCSSIAALSNEACWTEKLPSDVQDKVAEPFDLLHLSMGETVPGLLTKYLPEDGMDEVLDVMPVTEAQRLFLRGPPEYITFHLRGPVDTTNLEKACEAVIRKHSILRTVFFEDEGRLFQVVLKNPHHVFSHRRCVSSISQFAETLWQEQSSKAIDSCLPITQFFFATQGPSESFLILRISHAQYDAESMNYIYQDLFSAYNKQLNVDSLSDFGTWMYDFLSHDSEDARSAWGQVLEGSSMTYIGDPFLPAFVNERQISIEKITNRTTPPPGVTMASLVKAAWAVVLAEESNSRDVVFGQWVHCPHSQGISGNIPIVGPCLNTIPVRVKPKLPDTILQLLEEVQAQNTRTLPHNRVQLSDISQACAWPSNTVFGSELLHISEEHGTKCQIQVDPELTASIDVFWPQHSPPRLRWLLMVSKLEGENHSLCMFTTSAYVDEGMGSKMIERWCQVIHLLADNPGASLQTLCDREADSSS